MLLVWYPAPLFEATGTGRLPVFLVLLAVALGPLGRSRATRTAVVQLIVLAGCALALYLQRPVYLVFTVDRFDLVIARDIDPRDLAKAAPEFQRRPLGAPRYVAAFPPADPAEVQRILGFALGGGKDLQAYPQHYVPYAQQAGIALKRAKPVDGLLGKAPGALESYAAESGRALATIRFLPLRAKKLDGVVLVDAVSGLPLKVLAIDPW